MLKKVYKNWIYFLSAFFILLIIIIESKSNSGDFNIFLSASKDLFEGKNIYETHYFDGYRYYYDLIFAIILYPFTHFPLFVGKFFWLALNVFFTIRIWKIILSWISFEGIYKKNENWIKFFSFLFIVSFLRDNFHLAQMTIFILFISLESINAITQKKYILGSSLLAIGITIKILPIVIIPYLFYRREFKAVMYTFIFIVLLLFIPSLLIGFEQNSFLLVERWKLINPLNKGHVLDTDERTFHSITTFLSVLLVKDCQDWHAMNIKRNIADISIQNLAIIINIVRLFFITMTLYILKPTLFKSATSTIQRLYEVSYICIITPLIFPHQQYYAFLYIFPGSTYLIFYYYKIYIQRKNPEQSKKFKYKKYLFLTILTISFVLTSSHFFLGKFNNYYDHFKTLTYGVIFLVFLLITSNPKKINS